MSVILKIGLGAAILSAIFTKPDEDNFKRFFPVWYKKSLSDSSEGTFGVKNFVNTGLSLLDSIISKAHYQDYFLFSLVTVNLEISNARVQFLGIFNRWIHLSTVKYR